MKCKATLWAKVHMFRMSKTQNMLSFPKIKILSWIILIDFLNHYI